MAGAGAESEAGTGSAEARSVQSYLDETPRWRDGTPAVAAPITATQRRIWWLAVAGKFFEGLVVFMTGVALPLIGKEFALSPVQYGMVGAATLFGILIGATALGGLSDRFGRKPLFVIEMALFTIFLVAILPAPSFAWLLVCLLGMGVALGCDYPTAHVVISESTPTRGRGARVLGAFGFQAVGALVGTAVGFLILNENPTLGAWRWMYATAIVPAALVTLARLSIPESAHWLNERGRRGEAEHALKRLLRRRPPYPRATPLPAATPGDRAAGRSETGYGALFRKGNRRALVLASVPWFLQDLGTYGIGIFTPTILASAVGHGRPHAHSVTDIVANEITAAKGAAFLDTLLILGIIAAVVLADRVGRIRLQVVGFVGCALGLLVAALSDQADGATKTALIFAGFMLFNFSTNIGPNAQTYLLAGEVFATPVRGKGAGFAASFAKIGAVVTAFLFPLLLEDLGSTTLLAILVGTSLLGAVVTWAYRIETAGVSLEEVGRSE